MAAGGEEQTEAPVREGEVIAGKYEVLRVVARGGMGVVVAARHIELGHSVALKFLLRTVALLGPEAIPRFQREARSIVQMKSEHVVRVSDVGTLPSGEPYLVMELLEGTDLKELVEKQGPVSIARAADYVIQALDALAEAHAVGIVHRDIKPANLFMTKRADGSPLIKVLDFGVAKVTDPLKLQAASPTATGSMMGSPQYMAPEQILNAKDVDARCDVWALGAVLFELVTGKVPFDGESIGVLFNQIMNLGPTPLSKHLSDVSPEFEMIVMQCLEKDVSKRISNVADLAKRLLPFAPPTLASEVARIERLIRPAPASGGTAASNERKPIEPPRAPDVPSLDAPRIIIQPSQHPSPPQPIANTGSAWGLGKTSNAPNPENAAVAKMSVHSSSRLPIILGAVIVMLITVGTLGAYQHKRTQDTEQQRVDTSASGPLITADAAPLLLVTPSSVASTTTADPSASALASGSASVPRPTVLKLPTPATPATSAHPSTSSSSTKSNPIDMKLQ
jgi:eukaryotic-like serine/threonine-protein kinase